MSGISGCLSWLRKGESEQVACTLIGLRPPSRSKKKQLKEVNASVLSVLPTPLPSLALCGSWDLKSHTLLWTHSTSQPRKWHIVGGYSGLATRIQAISSWWRPLQWEIKTHSEMTGLFSYLPNFSRCCGRQIGFARVWSGRRNGGLVFLLYAVAEWERSVSLTLETSRKARYESWY